MATKLSQDLWKTKVVLYLFCEGAGAGCYFIAVLADFFKGSLSLFVKPGLISGVVLVILGAVFLWLDLGKKERFYWVFRNPKTSWIGRGAIFVTLFLALGVSYILSSIWPSTWLNGVHVLKLVWGSLSALFALAIAIYPGMLLKSFNHFKFWDNPMIVLLFTIISLLSGMAILLLIPFAAALRTGTTTELLVSIRLGLSIGTGLLLAEIVTLVVYLVPYAAGSSEQVPLLRLTQGDLRHYFIATAVVGWILPLIFLPVGLFAGGESLVPISLISVMFLLVGSLLTRHILLVAPTREIPFLPGLM